MIKIKTKFNPDTNIFLYRMKSDKTCTMEHVGIITKLWKNIKDHTEYTDEEIYESVKTALSQEEKEEK